MPAPTTRSRFYYGHLIQPAGPNTSGIRWVCLLPNYGWVRADSLTGIQFLIRTHRTPR